jgi:competence protein ComEC
VKKLLTLFAALTIFLLSACEDILLLLDANTSAEVAVHFIDVGQGDSILIKSPQGNMLIDAGESDAVIQEYLDSQNVTDITYAVGTHPHSDHIGALDFVINNYNVENVILSRKTHTTRAYENLIKAMRNKNLKPLYLDDGESFALGDIEFFCYGPVKEYEEINSNSVVLKMVYGNVKALFAGDAESDAERDMMAAGYDLRADVYKVSHHGSRTSSSKEFVQTIAPGIAIISCGKNNEYGHPHEETLKTLNNEKITVYRTDLSGTIILITNGESIDVYNHTTFYIKST